MSDKERLQLEQECLLKYSKAQMIEKYIDEFEENLKLSELWCKSQQENKQLKEDFAVLKKLQMISNDILTELEEWLQSIIYEIEPMGCSINYNCEYDSEEDYINAMKEQSKLNTLKIIKDKIQKLKEKYNGQ